MPAALCFAYPARFFHSRLFNTDLLAHFGFFSLFPPCSACYCWYCCCCCCRCLRRRRRPRRLILLEHNFNFCYVANTTHILFLFSFFARLLCRTLLLLYFTSLICLRTHRSGRCLDHPFWILWDTGTLHQAGFSMCVQHRSAPVRTLPEHTSQNALDPT